MGHGTLNPENLGEWGNITDFVTEFRQRCEKFERNKKSIPIIAAVHFHGTASVRWFNIGNGILVIKLDEKRAY